MAHRTFTHTTDEDTCKNKKRTSSQRRPLPRQRCGHALEADHNLLHNFHNSTKSPPVTTLAHVVYVRLRQSVIPLPLVTIVTFPDIFHD